MRRVWGSVSIVMTAAVAMVFAALLAECAKDRVVPAPAPAAAAVFDTQVRPILERCRPCHFEGGTMYGKLPFDRPETIRALGTKLFTRIKDEKDQATIRAFLEQSG